MNSKRTSLFCCNFVFQSSYCYFLLLLWYLSFICHGNGFILLKMSFFPKNAFLFLYALGYGFHLLLTELPVDIQSQSAYCAKFQVRLSRNNLDQKTISEIILYQNKYNNNVSRCDVIHDTWNRKSIGLKVPVQITLEIKEVDWALDL